MKGFLNSVRLFWKVGELRPIFLMQDFSPRVVPCINWDKPMLQQSCHAQKCKYMDCLDDWNRVVCKRGMMIIFQKAWSVLLIRPHVSWRWKRFFYKHPDPVHLFDWFWIYLFARMSCKYHLFRYCTTSKRGTIQFCRTSFLQMRFHDNCLWWLGLMVFFHHIPYGTCWLNPYPLIIRYIWDKCRS